MRVLIFCFFSVSIFFSNCSKIDKDLKKKYNCEKLSGYHKFIYEPIVISEDCNCIVSGSVKYIKDCQTVALVEYGNGECDNVATKIICKDGNCFDKEKNPIKSFDYTLDCNGNSINDGLVSDQEIQLLHDPNSGPQP